VDDLVTLARRQNGVFTRQQALALGVPLSDIVHRQLRDEWVERHRHVYIAATQPAGIAGECRAALFAVGGDSALSGRSAAWVWRLPGVDSPEVTDVVVAGDTRRRHLAGVRVRRVSRASFNVIVRGGWPVTPLEETVRDLAAELPTAALRGLVQALVLERRTTLDRLTRVLGRGHSGSARLRQVVNEMDPRFHSHWEQVLHRALVRAGLAPTAQVALRAPSGRRCYIDLGFPDIKLGIEIDGFLPHMRRFASDRRRNNDVCLELGWELAHFAIEDLAERLPEVVAQICTWVAARRGGAAA
jgi:very-short-patch-repair endonuclease